MLVLKIRRVSNLQITNSGSPIIEQTEKVWVRPNYTKFRGGRRSKNMEGPLPTSNKLSISASVLFYILKIWRGPGPLDPSLPAPLHI